MEDRGRAKLKTYMTEDVQYRGHTRPRTYKTKDIQDIKQAKTEGIQDTRRKTYKTEGLQDRGHRRRGTRRAETYETEEKH